MDVGFTLILRNSGVVSKNQLKTDLMPISAELPCLSDGVKQN